MALGLTLLLIGLKLMRAGLGSWYSPTTHRILTRFASRPSTAFASGLVLTALVHSSSLVTLLTMGLTEARLLTLKRSIEIILGANVGTTFTPQLMSIKLGGYAIPLLVLGLIFLCLARRPPAVTFFGTGLIFQGLDILESAGTILRENLSLISHLDVINHHPWMGVAAGTLAATALQSSTATMGLIISLAWTGLIDLRAGIALMLGANIGTCTTALLVSLASSRVAQRLAVINILLNIGGSLVFVPLLDPFCRIVAFTSPEIGHQIANAHTIYNLITSLAVLPFSAFLARLGELILPERSPIPNQTRV